MKLIGINRLLFILNFFHLLFLSRCNSVPLVVIKNVRPESNQHFANRYPLESAVLVGSFAGFDCALTGIVDLFCSFSRHLVWQGVFWLGEDSSDRLACDWNRFYST